MGLPLLHDAQRRRRGRQVLDVNSPHKHPRAPRALHRPRDPAISGLSNYGLTPDGVRPPPPSTTTVAATITGTITNITTTDSRPSSVLAHPPTHPRTHAPTHPRTNALTHSLATTQVRHQESGRRVLRKTEGPGRRIQPDLAVQCVHAHQPARGGPRVRGLRNHPHRPCTCWNNRQRRRPRRPRLRRLCFQCGGSGLSYGTQRVHPEPRTDPDRDRDPDPLRRPGRRRWQGVRPSHPGSEAHATVVERARREAPPRRGRADSEANGRRPGRAARERGDAAGPRWICILSVGTGLGYRVVDATSVPSNLSFTDRHGGASPRTSGAAAACQCQCGRGTRGLCRPEPDAGRGGGDARR